MTNTQEFIEKIVDRKIGEKTSLIEAKLRHSFRAIKEDNDSIKSSIAQLQELIAKNTLAHEKADLEKQIVACSDNLISDIKQLDARMDKRVKEDDELNKKFSELKKEISKKDIKNSVTKELFLKFDKKIETNFEKVDKKFKEFKDGVGQYKESINSLFESNSKILEQEHAEKRKEFENKIERNSKNIEQNKKELSFEFRVFKDSTNSQVEEYKSNLENYSRELAREYEKSKKEMKSMVERKIESLRVEEVKKLQGQVSYLKGRVNSILGKEEAAESEKKSETKKQTKKLDSDTESGFLNKIVNSLAD